MLSQMKGLLMDRLPPESPNEALASQFPADGEVLEISLLVPGWQLPVLDELARRQGQNVGQMLRRVISALVTEALPTAAHS